MIASPLRGAGRRCLVPLLLAATLASCGSAAQPVASTTGRSPAPAAATPARTSPTPSATSPAPRPSAPTATTGQVASRRLGTVTTITPATGCNVLTPGMNGIKVKRVQSALGLPGDAWETMDAATTAAVRRFQAAHGLEVDGVVGPRTWAALGFTDDFCAPDHVQQRVLLPAGASSEQRREQLVTYLLDRLGTEYVWGAAGPDGYDCSGIVLQGLYGAGLDPQPISVVLHAQPEYRTSRELYEHPGLLHVDLSDVRRGDLVFYRSDATGRVNHVAVALDDEGLGDGRVVEAVEPVVRIGTLDRSRRTQTVMPTVVRPFP